MRTTTEQPTQDTDGVRTVRKLRQQGKELAERTVLPGEQPSAVGEAAHLGTALVQGYVVILSLFRTGQGVSRLGVGETLGRSRGAAGQAFTACHTSSLRIVG